MYQKPEDGNPVFFTQIQDDISAKLKMCVLSRVTALTGLYLHSSLIRLLKHLWIRLAREKEVLGQHEKAALCWPVSLFFHSMKFPDKCFHGKFILAEFSSPQHSVVSQTH